ncbi:hypothetical protein A2U01_0098268, partial [Trifolium medium]|nr:hypothetical protein [Trifolium medium]
KGGSKLSDEKQRL